MAGLRDPDAVPGFFLARLSPYKPIRPIKRLAGGRIVVPERLRRRMPIMRLVSRGVARYDEIRQFWDLSEVIEANEILDIQDDAAWWEGEEARRKMKTSK